MHALNRIQGYTLLIGTCLLTGCQGPTDTVPEQPGLQTDRSVYDLRAAGDGYWEVSIPYHFVNTTGAPVYLPNCHGDVSPALEQQQPGGWVRAYTPPTRRCISEPIVVRPGASYDDVLLVIAAARGSGAGQEFEVDPIQGTYRLVWLLAFRDYDEDQPTAGALLPLDQRISNPFELRHPR